MIRKVADWQASATVRGIVTCSVSVLVTLRLITAAFTPRVETVTLAAMPRHPARFVVRTTAALTGSTRML